MQRGVAHLQRGERPASRGDTAAAILEVLERRDPGHAERLQVEGGLVGGLVVRLRGRPHVEARLLRLRARVRVRVRVRARARVRVRVRVRVGVRVRVRVRVRVLG